MGIISWIIVGGLAGWLGAKIMGRKNQLGFVATVVLGIIGAFVGGFLISILGGTGVTGINLWSIFVAALGSIVFIWLAQKIGS